MKLLWILGDTAIFCITLYIAIYIGITVRKIVDKFFGTEDISID